MDFLDRYRDRFGVGSINRVLTEHRLRIAPSTYYAAKQRGIVSEAVLAEAYAANPVSDLWVANGGFTACASSGTRPDAPPTPVGVTRWDG